MKLGKVRFKQLATRDLDALSRYIARSSVENALRFLEAVERDAARLASMPGIGRKREFRNPRLHDVRSWPIGGFENFLIFYRPVRQGIEVVRVLHGARNIARIFRQ